MKFLLLLLLMPLPVFAADADDVAKQKAAIGETAKKLKLKLAIVETPELIVASPWPEAKAKTLADSAQKALDVAKDNLQFAKEESLVSGKLTVYAFADHADLKSFIRQVELRRPEGDAFSISLRGNTPHIALSPDAGAKLSDAELASLAAGWTASAALANKLGAAGPPIPEWIQVGYGRACAVRGESAIKQSAYRAKVKAIVAAKNKVPPAAKDLWSGTKIADRDLMAGSLIEYLAFGPVSEKFLGFARAARGSDDGPPNMDEALKTLDTSADNLDYAWKTWIIKGK